MKVKIDRYRDKLAISTEEPRDTIQLGSLLRSLTGDPGSVLSFKNGYLVPRESANVLAMNFPPETHVWDHELRQIALEALNIIQAQSAAKEEVARAIESPYDALKDYAEVWRLDKHQVEAVAAMTAPSLQGMALFDEQGVGKTICALAAFDVLRQRNLVSHLLVVAPKSVLPVWKNESRSLFSNRYVLKTITGKQARPMDILATDSDIFLASYEAVMRESTILKGLMATKNRRFMLVVDESYYVKNPDAQRSRHVAELRQWCKRAYVLCGAPAPNSCIDVINQIDIADGGLTFGVLSVPKDEDAAASVIRESLGNSAIWLRRLKEEVLPSLPAKSIEKVFVDLQPIQAHLYEDALQNLVLDVRQADDTYFTKHLREFMARKWALLQVCSNPQGIDPLYAEQPAKLLALDRIIKEIVEQGGLKVVVWSFFRHSLTAIARRYQHLGMVKIDGSVDSIEERNLAVQRFQGDPGVMVFLGNPAAAGAGITLTAASHAIYESFSNQPAHYLQSVDRIHRRGQEKPVTTHVIMCRQTIEEREFDRLLTKERRGHDLFGKHPSESVTRERFLQDLLEG